MVVRPDELFLNEYSRYHKISIAPKDRYETTFVIDLGSYAIWNEEWTSYI
jgi:hypothetical protein